MYFPTLLLSWMLVAGDFPETQNSAAARRQPHGWNDRRRTVRSYPANLGYNALRVFGRANGRPLLIGSGLTAGAALLDDETVAYFDRHPMKAFGEVGAAAGGAGAVAALTIGLFSAGRIAPGDTFRSATYDASQSIIIASVYTFALKSATHRERPDGSNHRSFPSGHASAAFAWATVLGRHYGLEVEIPAYAVASLIAGSRLAHRAHYLSDIVAGATLGHAVARTVVRGNSRPAAGEPADPLIPRPSKRQIQILPSSGPSGDGSGLEISIFF